MEQNYKEIRPWGTFENLIDKAHTKVKILTVKPNEQLSLQSHEHRDEDWIIVKGNPTIFIDEKKFMAKYGNHYKIPRGSKHRIANETSEVAEIIEVQTGDGFDEDDIKRYDDIYGRVD